MVPTLRPPWGKGKLLGSCHGFTACAGNVKLMLGYATFSEGAVLLFVYESLPQRPLTVWRTVWTTPDSLDRSAEDLLADVNEYLDMVGPQRPSEDLDMNDFFEHLTLGASNGFN